MIQRVVEMKCRLDESEVEYASRISNLEFLEQELKEIIRNQSDHCGDGRAFQIRKMIDNERT
jgi:hypothetical protein